MARLRCRAPVLLIAAAAMALPQTPGPRDSDAAPSGGRETLSYSIEWRLISAGAAKFSWTALPKAPGLVGTPAPGSPVSEVRLHLESTGLVSRLFRVDDDYTATLGQGFCAQNLFLTAHEGSRSKETRVVFDSPNRKATWTESDLVKNATSTRDTDVPSCVHDVIGGLIVLRNLKLEPGKTAQIPISDGKKFVQARVESQRREELRTDLGSFRTVRYEVFLFDNVLYKRSGHLHVWLTDDERRLPVQLQVRLQFTIGTITFRLVKEEK